MSKTAYLISYDNGADYEDHSRHPLFLVKTRAQATRMVAQAAKWVERERAKLPTAGIDADSERIAQGLPDLTDEEHVAFYERRRDHISTLQPPFGITSLREAVDDHCYLSNGHLVVTEVPYYTQTFHK